MKALIIYFSGTGNTGMITDEIVSGLRREGWDAEAVSIERLDTGSRDFNFNLRTMDLLGFGFPVYKFTYPEIMESIFPFLSNLKPSRKPFFVYSTYCRFSAASLHRFASAIEAVEAADPGVHHIPVAMRSFKCPSNGIASLKEPGSRDYREVMYFSPGIGNLIDAFVNEISNGFELYHKNGEGIQHCGGLIDSFREKIVAGIERSRYPLLTIDRELCTVCGLCAKRCPDDNLVLSTEGEERADNNQGYPGLSSLPQMPACLPAECCFVRAPCPGTVTLQPGYPQGFVISDAAKKNRRGEGAGKSVEQLPVGFGKPPCISLPTIICFTIFYSL